LEGTSKSFPVLQLPGEMPERPCMVRWRRRMEKRWETRRILIFPAVTGWHGLEVEHFPLPHCSIRCVFSQKYDCGILYQAG
jgi:hypothetical protein